MKRLISRYRSWKLKRLYEAAVRLEAEIEYWDVTIADQIVSSFRLEWIGRKKGRLAALKLRIKLFEQQEALLNH